ncbi:hypothetical protein S7335_362 [Synechococcus sp. PCC 7335]|uniref:cupin domain-containing protein n=1 Tax=Synechococcus sp. (strain ATCC 29403 / PCC 7335) TaxID=91464 RepID=UPI00017EC08F|nr:cupin domain-containing protein [Synechococcus sp. PCC 7335]EDX83092.1 hypothetical protein S7335_270 [Synechococcus sp. PCC 7335]EDX83183.1 hypothetical protein S7335_362 [Synechococcus sp. PCC 7335]
MFKIISLVVAFLLSMMFCVQAFASEPADRLMGPAAVQWRENSEIAGVKSAVAVGDPSTAELYALLGKMDEGTVFPLHHHPDDRITTVISGIMYYGVAEEDTSEQMNLEAAVAYPAGSVVYTPAGTLHYMWAKEGELVAQETGFGPTGIDFIDASENEN